MKNMKNIKFKNFKLIVANGATIKRLVRNLRTKTSIRSVIDTAYLTINNHNIYSIVIEYDDYGCQSTYFVYNAQNTLMTILQNI